jgi:hypothetical protein
VSQQTPSTQFPDVQAPAPEHDDPFPSFATQLPAEQKSPAAQSASAVHVVRHDVDPQVKGAHVLVVADGHAPAPLQLAEAVAIPLAQLAARQLVEEPG